MKSYWMLFLWAFVLVFSMTGCGGSSGEGSSETYGSAAFQIQWPDGDDFREAAVSGDGDAGMAADADRRLARAYLFSECETRNVVTIAVEVTDDQERLLASAAFECEAREGVIENIEVGTDRRFAVSALDPEGEMLFSGEKTGVAIESGHNEVGVIVLGSDNGVIISPHVEITAPEDGAVYMFGDEITFSGMAVDEQGGELSGDALVWRSDIDNSFGTGTSLVTSDLSPGIHVITLTATDGDSNTGEDSISITISEAVNAPPVVTITGPPDESVHSLESAVNFAGSATDAEDGDLTGEALVWTSDIDNEFGSGNFLTFFGLSTGTHVITLTATDSDSNTGEDSISITISEPTQESPVVTIMRPIDGSRHTNNGNIYFEGAASDPQDGELTGETLVWTSDRDGAIGSGEIFVSMLSAGVHEITLTATDSDGLEGEAAVSIAVIVPGLPDTGQTTSYTTTFGEDADYTIRPPSYTKLDDTGSALPDNATAWAMVQDNVTGLVWEVKTTDASIHNNTDRYTWNEADSVFVNALNQDVFGGYDDWRLPTIMELYTIIHADNVDPAVNTDYFPNVPDVARPYYWSATPRADSPSEWIWVIDFGSGQTVGYEEEVQHVRAVRGAFFQTGRFVDNGNETVTDRSTGLMWQKGITYYGWTWEEALNFCEVLELAGYADWRMPNRNELHSLVDYQSLYPALDMDFFGGIEIDDFWSSTSSPENNGTAYSVDFIIGWGDYLDKSKQFCDYRCVRGGH
ncbi:MAG: DUF1566 domain-containing protein [Desulfosalsimonadaceae bacterium]